MVLLSLVAAVLVVLEAIGSGALVGLDRLQPWLAVCFAALMLDLCGVLLHDWMCWFRFARPGVAARPTEVEDEPTEVLSPVVGHWRALNSPADRVPSRGTHRFAQAYAIRLTADPTQRAGRPGAAGAWWPVVRGNGDFPAFGAPVLACADATVMAVEDRRRDHTARGSYPALPLLWVERVLRAAVGPSGMLGNYVVLRLDAVPRPPGAEPEPPSEDASRPPAHPGSTDAMNATDASDTSAGEGRVVGADRGVPATAPAAPAGSTGPAEAGSTAGPTGAPGPPRAPGAAGTAGAPDPAGRSAAGSGHSRVLTFATPLYAVYAHLQRGSLAVREGDTLRAGQQLARCGNTGDSTEPHLHFQLMDGPRPERARGKPFAWRDVGVPAEGELFSVASL